MPYNEGALTPPAPTTIEWAIAWTRLYLRDTNSDAEVFTDAEVEAVNDAQAWTYTDPDTSVATTYFRPHLAAAHLVEADPDRATSESTLGASVTTRSPAAIARSIRRAGRWIDDTISSTVGDDAAPTSSLTINPSF